MKRVVVFILVITVFCFGCVKKEIETINNDPSNKESVAHESIRQNQTKSLISPNSKYRAEAYGTIATVTAGGLYPYKGISVVDVEKNEVIWKMEPGYYFVDFVWSQDSHYVGIYYEARIYGESVIINTMDRKIISLPALIDIASHYDESVKPQGNRPDPYFKIVGWKDTERVIVDFRWSKEDSEYFSGQYIFNLKTHEITYL